MAGNSLSLVWDLVARDGASPVFERVGTAAETAGAKTEAASTKVNAGFSTAAKAAGAAGIVFAAASVKMAADFQSSTVRLVTSANESQKNLKMIQQGMLNLAGTVGYSTDELSKAMYKVESGGQHGAAALATLKAAAQGAKTENADLTTVADALTSAMTDYHLKASDAATVTSKLVAATASGKMTFEELSGSLAAILPVASANHVALNDVLGDLASMTMHGMSAEQASQNLADAIRHLAAPTQQQQKEFAALGLTTQQITADLGTKGLSGTINVIGDAIRAQMGPQTGQVVLDLNTALSKLPVPVKTLGQSILDGTISLDSYRKQMKALPPEQAIAAQSFMALVSSTHQIGNETKNGAEVYQSYSGALRQALGDATGMNVALMIGGENAGNTAKAIANVSKATADAKGNVKGWSEIQGTFNQQASETLHSLEAMTIEAGMHLLPAMTSAMGYINRDAIPAIKGLASGASDAIHWWSQLPSPIKDVSLALAGLALSNAIGLTGKLSSGVQALGSSAKAAVGGVGGLSEELKLQQALAAMDARSLTEVDMALGAVSGSAVRAAGSLSLAQTQMKSGAFAGWDYALSQTAVQGEAAVGTIGRMSSGLAALSTRAQAAGSGLVNMLGGPWVVATAVAAAGIYGLVKAFTAESDEIKANTQYLLDNMKAQDQIGQSGREAAQKVADFEAHINNLHAAISNIQEAASSSTNTAGLGRFGNQLEVNKQSADDLRTALDQAKVKYQEYLNSLTPVERAQAMVAKATNDLNVALRDQGPNSDAVTAASGRLQSAQALLTSAQQQANDATKTHLQLLQQQASSELAAVSSALAAQQAQLSFSQALDQYNKDAKDGQHNSAQLAQEQNSLAQSAISAAQAAGQQAADQAKANGVTDTANASNQAMLKSLQAVAAQMGGATPAAITQAIAALSGATVQTGSLSDAISKMGLTTGSESARFRQEWGNNTQVLKGATDAQIRDLQGLGYTVMTLPNHEIVVSASTSAARNAITQLTNDYAQYSINVGLKIGTSAFARAGGGPVWGAGTSTSDSIPAMLSDREWVIKAASADKYGHKAMASVNAGTATIIPHLAGGGTLADMYLNAKVGISPSSLTAASGSIKSQLSSFATGASAGGAGGAARWAGVVLQALAMLGQPASLLGITLRRMNQESGGNPNAINLWDSNAKAGYPSQGLMQTIPSTFAAYHYPGTSYNIDDPLANVLASMRYALARYGSLSAAYGRVGGYKLGTNFVPSDQLALLHKGEAVVPAAQNQGAPYQSGPMSITGTLRIDGDGLAHIVDGRVEQAFALADQQGAYNG